MKSKEYISSQLKRLSELSDSSGMFKSQFKPKINLNEYIKELEEFTMLRTGTTIEECLKN